MTNHKPGFLSLAQVAKKMKISRIAVYKKVKKGEIEAQRIGKSYAVSEELLPELNEETLVYGNEKGEALIKQGKSGPEVAFKFKDDNLWLTQKQISNLFEQGVPSINECIKKIINEAEVDEKSVIRKIRITASDGKGYETSVYGLDMIMLIGFRIKSAKASMFRIWATEVLREYLLKSGISAKE